MDGVLNEVTATVHEHERGQSDFRAACGALSDVAHDDLRMTDVESTVATTAATRCGRCFDDGGGY